MGLFVQKECFKGCAMKSHAFRVTFVILVSAFLIGCNTSRYGLSYDQRLPLIKKVAIVPLNIGVSSLHTGGVSEPRPDLTAEVGPRLLSELQRLITRKGYQTAIVQNPLTKPATPKSPQQSHALAAAVEQSIVTHHYVHGKSLVFDYSLGEVVQELQGRASDVILCVNLTALVPTKGRQGLMVTAAVVSALTGVKIHIKTNEAALTLMLIDRQTGDVLWYNRNIRETNVRKKRALRNLVKRTGAFLLKPKKK